MGWQPTTMPTPTIDTTRRQRGAERLGMAAHYDMGGPTRMFDTTQRRQGGEHRSRAAHNDTGSPTRTFDTTTNAEVRHYTRRRGDERHPTPTSDTTGRQRDTNAAAGLPTTTWATQRPGQRRRGGEPRGRAAHNSVCSPTRTFDTTRGRRGGERRRMATHDNVGRPTPTFDMPRRRQCRCPTPHDDDGARTRGRAAYEYVAASR